MTVSIITTTFNRADYIPEMIKSIENLKLDPLSQIQIELVMYDDGSTDNTPEVMRNYNQPWIKYIRSNENSGPSLGRNTAIAQSSGEYIFILDSDDVILQRTIVNLVLEFIKDPNLMWIETDFLRTNKNLQYLFNEDHYGWNFKDTKEMLQAIFNGDHFIQGNVMFKRKMFDEVKGYDKTMHMGEDLDLYIRFLFAGYFPMYKPIISHLHRIHETNLSKDISIDKHKSFVSELKNKYKDRLTTLGIL